MNTVDEIGNDLAVAFLVEKKYSQKLNPNESKALIGRIRDALRGDFSVRAKSSEPFTPVKAAVNRNG